MPSSRRRARAAAGDTDWAKRLDEYEEGIALLVCLQVTVGYQTGDGQEQSIRVENRGLWVEDHAHPPKVTQQIAELAHKDYPRIAEELRGGGLEVGEGDLDQMFVNASFGDDVLDALSGEHCHPNEGVRSDPGLT